MCKHLPAVRPAKSAIVLSFSMLRPSNTSRCCETVIPSFSSSFSLIERTCARRGGKGGAGVRGETWLDIFYAGAQSVCVCVCRVKHSDRRRARGAEKKTHRFVRLDVKLALLPGQRFD